MEAEGYFTLFSFFFLRESGIGRAKGRRGY